MKVYERYERVFRVPGRKGKRQTIFSFLMAPGGVFGSFFYMMFINFAMRTVFGCVTSYFMNIMKIYEEGLFKCDFRNRPLITDDFMNLPGWPCFIHVHKGGWI